MQWSKRVKAVKKWSNLIRSRVPFSWAAAVAPFRAAATGQGHRAGGPFYRPPSRAGHTRRGRSTGACGPSHSERLAGRHGLCWPSRSQLARLQVGPSPLCRCCCTVPGSGHRTVPQGRRAIIQATVPGQTHQGRSTGACGPPHSERLQAVGQRLGSKF